MRYGPLLLACLLIFGGEALANLWAVARMKSLSLDKEQVEVEITGQTAAVSGTFSFAMARSWEASEQFDLYLPVYASPQTNPASVRPSLWVIDMGEDGDPWKDDEASKRELKMEHLLKHSFGELPTVEGLIPFWFKATIQKGDLKGRRGVTLEMAYRQKLVDGVFIYTPIIPKQKKGRDYGTITILSDRLIDLRGKAAHETKQTPDGLVIKPSHKRAIVVKVEDAPGRSPNRGDVIRLIDKR